MNRELNTAGSKALDRLNSAIKQGGTYYSLLYSTRWVLDWLMDALDGKLVQIEQRRKIVEAWSISARRFTTAHNKTLWNTYDWSQRGEEWTRSAEWKQDILDTYLFPYIPAGKTVLEIGPGAGRWTEILQERVEKLFVLEVAEQALSLCRERFDGFPNIEFLLGDGRTIQVPDSSLDAIWSYDVFVHINPADAQSYFREFGRVLKPGACAVIHHPGTPVKGEAVRPGWRSDLTDELVLRLIGENSLELVYRSDAHVNRGDFVSVVRRSSSNDPSEYGAKG
jgi:ubiquinone/menaquinone biosynthesis C-methylase UbiE